MFLFLNNINQRGYGFNRGGARANQCALSRKRNILGGGEGGSRNFAGVQRRVVGVEKDTKRGCEKEIKEAFLEEKKMRFS